MMTVACFGAGFLFHLWGKNRLRNATGSLGLLLLSISVIMIVSVARRMPLYGMFESMTTVLWIAAAGFFIIPQPPKSKPAFTVFYAIIILMACSMFFQPITPNHDFFMYASPWVQCFFFFKLLAAGVFLHSGIYFASMMLTPNGPYDKKIIQLPFLVMIMSGTALFLCSEFSGSIWCLKGWGDSWRWSGNFFQSALTFFIVMLNLHIPALMFKNPKIPSTLGTVSCFSIVGLLLW